jgi:hypothetical protein
VRPAWIRNLVRIIVIRDDAINSFGSTGNRMFIGGRPIGAPPSARENRLDAEPLGDF